MGPVECEMKGEHNRPIKRRTEVELRDPGGRASKAEPASPRERVEPGKRIVIKPMTRLERT